MLPSPDAHSLSRLLSTVVADPRTLPFTRLNDLRNATDVLKAKSKSFYAGCVLFEGQLQLDLLSLCVSMMLHRLSRPLISRLAQVRLLPGRR